MVIILIGVSGCGKSTIGIELSEKVGCLFLDGDDFHSEANIKKMSGGVPLTEADRGPWLNTLRRRIEQCLDSGENLVLACSALSRQSRDILRGNYNDVRFVYLQGNKELIGQRLKDRKGHFASSDLLDSQFDVLQEPESAMVVCITLSPQEIVAQISSELGLTL
jgi:gluconokinase